MKLSDELLYYLGLIAIIVVGVIIIYSMFEYQQDIIEGMTSSTDSKQISTEIKQSSSKILDGLLINKYRSNYEKTITNLLELTNAQILTHVLSSNSKDINGKFFPMVEKVNSLETFKTSLNSAMKFLDSK